jgi:malonate-semialdehyde dehydrogenase (acetylating) / methylmalonate-semialdehyde dehydrogenase
MACAPLESEPGTSRDARLPAIAHWIDGRAVTGEGEPCAVFDPCLGVAVRELRLATRAEVDRAVASATRAFPEWASVPAVRRARVMFRFKALLEANAGGLAALVSQEHGKTLADAAGEIARGLELVEFACGAPQLLKGELSVSAGRGIDCFDLRQPLGVVAGVTPFNFPAMVPLWMFPIALAAGNTFVLKPSERDPSASIRLAELIAEAGAPPGILNVVHGDKAAVDVLLEHPGIAAVSFVGSTPVARALHARAAAAGKRVQALGGAKNHLLVMPDADLDVATETLVGAAYGSAGERCMAISVALVVGEKAADVLVEKLVRRLAKLDVGPGDREGVEMGPLVSAAHRERVAGYINAGVEDGADLVLDGRMHPATRSSGFFLGPSLFDRVRPPMRIYREEIFGPVLCVVRTGSYREAVALINGHELANGACILTGSGAAARRFVEEVQAGMVGVNVPIPVPVAWHSFGGWRGSLYGDHHAYGAEAFRFYTRLKTVTQRWPDGEAPSADLAMPGTP